MSESWCTGSDISSLTSQLVDQHSQWMTFSDGRPVLQVTLPYLWGGRTAPNAEAT